jgi:hypothetical protein
MAMISPFREGISRQISACRRALSLFLFSIPQRWQNISPMALLVLGFWEDDIREGHWQRWTRAATPPSRAASPGLRLGVVWAPGGPSQPLLLATSVFW